MSVLDNLFDTSPEAKMAKKLGISKKVLENMFNDYDKDGSGGLDASELQTLAASIGLVWDADKVEEAVRAIDTDGNGVVDIKEFATWFCQQPEGGDEASEMLKVTLQAKIMIRMITEAIKSVTDDGDGRECVNQAGFQVGDLDPETCSGMLKFFCHGSSAEDLAALNPPEDAFGAVHLDFTLCADASEENIQKIIDGANDAWESFAQPVIDDLPAPPQVPGMKGGQPFVGKRIEKATSADGEDVLRVIVFTGLDPSSIWAGTDLKAGEFVPSLHHASYMNHAISDIFNCEGPTSVADWVSGRAEYNFTWNTKTLKAMRAIVNTAPMKQVMKGNDGFGFRTVISVLAKAFRCQSSSFEVAFNGFQDIAEAMVLDGAMNAFEHKQEERARWGYGGGDGEDANPWEPLPERPSDEKVKRVIAAVGNLSGKTFGTLRKELLAQGPIFPNPQGRGVFITPLYPLKEMLDHVPKEMEEYKELVLTFLETASGVKTACACSNFAKVGAEAKGLDFFALLPSREEIEGSSAAEVEMHDPSAGLAHFSENGNLYTRMAMSEMTAAIGDGLVPNVPDEITAQLKKQTYDQAEWAAKKEEYSELIEVLKAGWDIAKDVPAPPHMPEEVANRVKEVIAKLLDA